MVHVMWTVIGQNGPNGNHVIKLAEAGSKLDLDHVITHRPLVLGILALVPVSRARTAMKRAAQLMEIGANGFHGQFAQR